jgi:hypothetical protein
MERSLDMNFFKKILIAASIVFIVSAFVPAAKAASPSEADWPTTVTFAEPVQIGNLVLTPGNYEFRLTPGTIARCVIEIYSVDRGSWVGMAMGINDSRVDTSKRSGFTFVDMGSGAPKALEYWFYPDWNRGIKFVYPHAQTASDMAAAIVPSAR